MYIYIYKITASMAQLAQTSAIYVVWRVFNKRGN